MGAGCCICSMLCFNLVPSSAGIVVPVLQFCLIRFVTRLPKSSWLSFGITAYDVSSVPQWHLQLECDHTALIGRRWSTVCMSSLGFLLQKQWLYFSISFPVGSYPLCMVTPRYGSHEERRSAQAVADGRTALNSWQLLKLCNKAKHSLSPSSADDITCSTIWNHDTNLGAH